MTIIGDAQRERINGELLDVDVRLTVLSGIAGIVSSKIERSDRERERGSEVLLLTSPSISPSFLIPSIVFDFPLYSTADFSIPPNMFSEEFALLIDTTLSVPMSSRDSAEYEGDLFIIPTPTPPPAPLTTLTALFFSIFASSVLSPIGGSTINPNTPRIDRVLGAGLAGDTVATV